MRKNTSDSFLQRVRRGQALIEYALILALVAIAFAIALAATGPAIGNVFSNAVYNLLGQTTTPRAIGGAGDFWMTITWVATQTPEEYPLPTRTLPPPSKTPTPGPSPTPTPVTPTTTPLPSKTPAPTPTPLDFLFTAPYYDPVDTTTSTRWRIDKNFFLSSDDWRGEYFNGTQLIGTPDFTKRNGEIDSALKYKLKFDWGSTGSPFPNWPSTSPGDNFSVRWKRQIYLETNTTLRFNTLSNDAMRVWILGGSFGTTAGSCGGLSVPSGGPLTGTSVTYGNPANHCLIIDKWKSGTEDNLVVDRTIPAGNYTIQVDYAEFTGDARISVDVINADRPANMNDTTVDGGGNPTSGIVDCNWGLNNDERNSNSLKWTWEEYTSGDFKTGMRCHLEFRGRVQIPSTMTSPEFTFWDVWDYRESSVQGWLELAEYKPIGDPARLAPGYWTRVDLRQGNSTNYNWTRHAVDVTAFAGKELTWRFVMQNISSTQIRRWYIDDIKIDQAVYKNFRPGMLWNLNGEDQKDDFITTGRWNLTNKNIHGAEGASWEDSPGGSAPPGDPSNTTYTRFYDSGQNATDARVHYVEFKGFIDVADVAGAADLEGDNGDPLLTFWHAYDVGPNTWLEVQYTTQPYGVSPTGANWQVVPGSPGGAVVPNNTSVTRTQTTMVPVTVPLKLIPATRFRLRFAMIVQQNASPEEDGWWIDDIYLEREGKPNFTNYPVCENAEGGDPNTAGQCAVFWNLGGTWSRTNLTNFDSFGSNAFTDSPVGDYQLNTNSAMTMRYPIDLNNDTPENLTPALNAAGRAGNTGSAASSPVMTFWHWRRINGSADALYVEYKKMSDPDVPANWKPLWGYVYTMATQTASPNSRTGNQIGWERVEIDLAAITYNPTDANKTDDDVLIRFRLYSDGSFTADGVYIDTIEIKNRAEKSHKLWATTTNISGLGTGNGEDFFNDVDSPADWWNQWHVGGTWAAIDWEQRNGLKAFHDSVTDPTGVQTGTQTAAPTGGPSDSVITNTDDTFNVLELQTIIDLRGTDATANKPTLYFWSRYFTGTGDKLYVQVSVENTANTSPCTGLGQCYEHIRGWNEWQTIWTVNALTRTYTWQREAVTLETYAKSGTTAGKRIKIRFVSDALDNADNRDGWYIDDVSVRFRNPPKLFALPFFDGARNMQNWIGEGFWGLDPELFRGSGGGPASLGGTWAAYYWDCSKSSIPTAQRCTTSEATRTDAFLAARPNNESPDRTEAALLDINKDFGLFSPVSGWTVVDRIAARFVQFTPVVGTSFLLPGEYTFITASDDGVRMRYENAATAAPPPAGTCNAAWNIICNWSSHGRTVDIGTATLVNGIAYKFTLEYYEVTNTGVIVLTLGTNSFSFNDTPKQGAGPSFPEIPAVRRGNSSLMLDGLLNLNGTNAPVLEYFTYYELDTNSYGRVEVSSDGGLSWTQSNLNNMGFSPTINSGSPSAVLLPGSDWQQRLHGLSSYINKQIGLRFRLDRLNSDCLSADRPSSGTGSSNNATQVCNPAVAGYNANGRGVGWWVVDIRVIDP